MQTRIDPVKRTAQYHWDSLGEMALWIERTPRHWCEKRSTLEGREYKWDLGSGYAGAVRMARDGWLEGAERVQNALAAFPAQSPKPDTRTDVYGFRPHVPRFCAGAPDSMIRHTNAAETGAGRVLTLVVELSMAHYVDAQRAANFGVAVAQYVIQLEAQGTRVELIGSMCRSLHTGWKLTQTVTIKGADQPLDCAVIAFTIGHPAMFRRIGHAVAERSQTPTDDGYGIPTAPKARDLINAPPGVVIFPGTMNEGAENSPTPEAGVAYVSRKIETALQAQEL